MQPTPLPAPSPMPGGGGGSYGPANSSNNNYQWVGNNSGGINYFLNGKPITNTAYQAGTGINTSQLEAGQLKAWQATQPQQPGGQVQGAAIGPSGGTGTGAGTGVNTAAVNALTGTAGGLVGDINGLYNSIYGQGGAYDTGLQNARNTIEAGYAPQYANVGLQANQLAQQLDWQNLANGTGVSSIAGQSQQNLANQASNEAGQITAGKQKDLQSLISSAQHQQGVDLANQQSANQNLALYKNISAQDPLSVSVLSNFVNNLQGTKAELSGNIAGNAPAGNLANSLNTAAPSQIFNPQTIQQNVQSIGQSSLPNYLQNAISNAYVQTNSPATNTNYWSTYLKNLIPGT